MSGGRRRSFVVAVVAFGALVAPALAAPSTVAQEPEPTTTLPPTSTTLPATSTTTVPGSTSTTLPGSPSSTSTTTTTEPDPDEGPDSLDYDPQALLELLSSYDEAVAMEAELLAQFELSMAQVNQLNQAMVDLSTSITAVESELLSAETALVEAEDRVDLAQVRLVEVEERLADAQHLLDEQAVEAYISGGSSAGFYALLNAGSAQDMDSVMTYAGVVSDQTDQAIDVYTDLQDEAEVLRAEAEDAADEATDARDEVETRRDALHVERERQAQAQADAFVAALAQQGLIAEIEAQRGSYEQRLRTLSGTSDSINGILRTRQEGQNLPDDTAGIFLPPLRNPVISSPFGPRLHPIFGTVRMHNGTDLDADAGAPIRAAADGEVVVAGWQGGYGFTVVIDHGNGLATLYAHQSAIVVLEGQQVEMGDTIGLVGSTGWSTGPHLHWEVRVFGNPTEPIAFMGGEELLWFAAAAAAEAAQAD
jgi:murein DD-endopeptidase MepM/ murein hydrolase activator NlpD